MVPATLCLAAAALLDYAAVRLFWGASVKVATPWIQLVLLSTVEPTQLHLTSISFQL